MIQFQKPSLTFFLLLSLLNLTCSSSTQDSDVKSVLPLSPASQIEDRLIVDAEKTPTPNPNVKIIKIDGDITDEIILQGRDLSLYKQTNTSKCGTYNCTERKMREFIWEHWKNKKQGYISSPIWGIDVTITKHIFIEPNEQGKWIVNWKMARNHSIFGNDILETLGIVSVEQVKSKNGRFKLEFKNKDGEILQTL
jgi:hypothetical protein